MNTTPRAARQLRTLEPGRATALLDALERQPFGASTSIVTVDGQAYRCFVGRHCDGSRVLLGLILDRNGDAP